MNILVARWLGVSPWELEAAPLEWRGLSLMLMDVLEEVGPILAERNRLRDEAKNGQNG